MTTNTKAGAPVDYVEIDLRIDLEFSLPVRNQDGTLGFEVFCPNEAFSITKVLVPVEATKDKSSLREYVHEKMRNWDADITDLDEVDIWDGNDKEGEGKFRFSD